MPGNHQIFIDKHLQCISPPTSKSSASLVRSIVALEGGNDGRSCHSLSDRVAWQPPSDDHAVPPVSGQRLADPPKVSSSLESILSCFSTRTNFLRSGTKRVGALTLRQPH